MRPSLGTGTVVGLLLLVNAAMAQDIPTGTPRTFSLPAELTKTLNEIDAQPLGGLFRFIEPGQVPAALASYLLYDHGALKRFVRRTEKDAKKVQAISRWHKLVLLHMVGMGLAGSAPGGGSPLSPKWVARVQELTLVRSIDYQDFMLRRGE